MPDTSSQQPPPTAAPAVILGVIWLSPIHVLGVGAFQGLDIRFPLLLIWPRGCARGDDGFPLGLESCLDLPLTGLNPTNPLHGIS